MCNIEKIGKVRFKTNYSIPKNCKYSNPYCSYNGRCWVLSFSVEVEENQTALNEDLSIGIDLGVKDLATCSNGDVFKNINKTKRIKNLKSKLKHLQRSISRKYEGNKQGSKFVKTNNIVKLEKQVKQIYRKLANIRNNHIHQTTNKIIKYYRCGSIKKDLKLKDREYKCDKCGLKIDRDYNASINLSNYSKA